MATGGRNVIVYVLRSGNWEPVAEQTDYSIQFQASTTTVGHKLSSFKSVLASSLEGTGTLNALWVPSNVQQKALEQALFSNQKIQLREYFEGNVKVQFTAIMTSLNKNYPEEGAATWSMGFTVDGDVLVLG